MKNMPYRTIVFLLVHAVILVSLFTMKLLGVAADTFLVAAAAVISMEAVYMAVFTKEATGKACQGVKDMKEDMAMVKDAATETTKLQRALLYTGHQIKNIQSELDVLKKRADFRPTGNGHRRLHHPIISHS